MDIVRRWTTLICLATAACIILELVLPPGKMEKTAHMVIGIFMLCIIMTPLTDRSFRLGFDLGKKIQIPSSEDKTGFPEAVNNQIESFMMDNIRSIVSGVLKDMGIRPKKIDIFMDTNKDNCISFIECKIFIGKDEQDKGMVIKREIKSKLGLETEVIVL